MNAGIFSPICVFSFFHQREAEPGAHTHLWDQPLGSRRACALGQLQRPGMSAGEVPSWEPAGWGRAQVAGICELDTRGAKVRTIFRVSMMAMLTHGFFNEERCWVVCKQASGKHGGPCVWPSPQSVCGGNRRVRRPERWASWCSPARFPGEENTV